MRPKQKLYLQVYTLLILGQQLNASKYQFVPENEDIFTDCLKQPSNVRGIEGMADTTDLSFTLNKDTISISGNTTFVWKFGLNDRIKARFDLFRYDRGSWLLTPFALSVYDFCKVMYDRNQYWYTFWTRHITNAAEVEAKCIHENVTIIQEKFDVDMTFDFTSIVPFGGRYKIQIFCKAFDQRNKERRSKICFNIVGEMIRAN